MKFPTKMTVAGQIVNVVTQPDPVYAAYTCPCCKDLLGDGTGYYRFYVASGHTPVCPACGCKQVQPCDSFVMGAYSPSDDLITLRVTEHNLEAAGTNFVHETIEAIDSICDLKLNHTQISTLGTVLYQAMRSGDVSFADAA